MKTKLEIANSVRYVNGFVIGMYIEYALRAESNYWYIPLSISILLIIVVIIDLTTTKTNQ